VDMPDEEVLAFSEEYGWEFVVRRGDFYIYRSARADVRELNTDPDVQALTLKAVEKRLRDSAFTAAFWLLFYPILMQLDGDGFLRPVITLGTGFSLFGIALSLWLFGDSVARVRQLSRLRRRLKLGGGIDHRKNWQKDALRNHILRISQIVLLVVWFCMLMTRLGNAIMEDEFKTPIAEYGYDVPFATFEQLCPEGTYTAEKMLEPNYIIEWSDWLSPYNAEWMECAKVKTDGGVIEGTLYVDYHETVHPVLARWLASEYHWEDRWDGFRMEDDYQPLELPELGMDYAVAYLDWLHWPTVILVKDNRMVKASIHSFSKDSVAVEEWAQVLAESIRRS